MVRGDLPWALRYTARRKPAEPSTQATGRRRFHQPPRI